MFANRLRVTKAMQWSRRQNEELEGRLIAGVGDVCERLQVSWSLEVITGATPVPVYPGVVPFSAEASQ